MDEQLRNALVSHDVKSVKELLKPSEALQPPVIDYEALSNQLLNFKWPLIDVVDSGKPELTRLFLRGNESINDDDGHLHRAVFNFDVDHVRLFLQEFNADPNRFYEDFHTPIYHLYSDNYRNRRTNCQLTSDHDKAMKIMKMLIDKGANIVTARKGYIIELQVIHILKNGTTEVVSMILDMDVIDLKERYNGGCTVAHYLAQNRNPNTLTLLQNRDFDVNSRNDSRYTPLWMAAAHGVAHAVEFLLNKGADMYIGDGYYLTPLRIVALNVVHEGRAEENHIECLFLLLDHGVDVQARLEPDGPDDDNKNSKTIFVDLAFGNRSVQRSHEIIIQHLALQAAIGTTVTKHIKKIIDSYDVLKEQLVIGRRLLQSQIFGSHTLLSVLTCEEEKLVSLMRNEQLAQILQSHSDHLKSIDSIYYNRLLQNRLTKAGQIIELRGKAAFVLGKLMKMDYISQPVVIDIILRYLDLADLDTLVSFISRIILFSEYVQK